MFPARSEPANRLPASAEVVSGNSVTAGEYVRQLAVVAMFLGFGVILSPICGALSALFGSRIPAGAGQRFIGSGFRFWLWFARSIGAIEVDFPEAGKLADLRGTILAPNHPTLLDAVALLAVVPRTVCIMRADLIKSPILGGAARLAGYVTNDRGPALIRQGIEKLRNGDNVLIFPEGTRTRLGSAVNSFKSGFALIAVKSGAPIQTIFIERDSGHLSKGVSILTPAKLPWRLRIRLGEVIRPGVGESAQELVERLQNDFQSRLATQGSVSF